ncbi:MAG TPA: hypothetical protein VL123_03970 [Candidatus Udaeobacter sp.]|jgi:hypothetical protein|nr:hypothetical protein [Candidatus Udaeobacter sp.]
MNLSSKVAAGLIVTAALVALGTASGKSKNPPAPQAPDSAAVSAAERSLDSLAATERAFAAMSVEQGMKPAFLNYLGRDGLVFRRGIVNGRKVWEARKNATGTLNWAPEFAEVAGNADLGWTTGPWEYKPPAGNDQPDYGTFVTVWGRPIEFVKEQDRVWRVVIDMGISHPRHGFNVSDVKLERGPLHPPVPLMRAPGVGFGVGVANGGFGLSVGTGRSARDIRWREMRHAVNDMMSTERSYGFDLQKKGASEAIGTYAADDIRLFREGVEPSVGKMPAIQALATSNRDRVWTPLGSNVSTSYDLGASWGLVRTRTAPRDTSAYLHIWRCPGGKWLLVADVENRFAPGH